MITWCSSVMIVGSGIACTGQTSGWWFWSSRWSRDKFKMIKILAAKSCNQCILQNLIFCLETKSSASQGTLSTMYISKSRNFYMNFRLWKSTTSVQKNPSGFNPPQYFALIISILKLIQIIKRTVFCLFSFCGSFMIEELWCTPNKVNHVFYINNLK